MDRRTVVTPPRYFNCQRNLYTKYIHSRHVFSLFLSLSLSYTHAHARIQTHILSFSRIVVRTAPDAMQHTYSVKDAQGCRALLSFRHIASIHLTIHIKLYRDTFVERNTLTVITTKYDFSVPMRNYVQRKSIPLRTTGRTLPERFACKSFVLFFFFFFL